MAGTWGSATGGAAGGDAHAVQELLARVDGELGPLGVDPAALFDDGV